MSGASVLGAGSFMVHARLSCVNACCTGGLSACSRFHGCVFPFRYCSPARSDSIVLSVNLALVLRDAPVAELSAFWQCPLPLLDDLGALLCRSCESLECAFAAGSGLWEFACWRALEPSLDVLQRCLCDVRDEKAAAKTYCRAGTSIKPSPTLATILLVSKVLRFTVNHDICDTRVEMKTLQNEGNSTKPTKPCAQNVQGPQQRRCHIYLYMCI